VAEAVRGQEAVICAVGPRSSRQPGSVISDAARNLVAAMGASGVQRLVFQSGMMVGEARGTSRPKQLVLGFFGWINRALKADKQIAERVVRESDLAWVLVRPPMIGPGPARGDYLAQEDVPLRLTTMSAADVAHAVLRAVTDPAWTRKVIELSNA
jgi:putative NADH-flavin reductase